MEIPNNHKAYISVSMQAFENVLCELEDTISSPAENKVLTETVNNLLSWERALILKHIEELKELINHLAQNLGLNRRKEEVRNVVLGAMTIELANLEELKSKRLRRYGEVPYSLQEFLDPQVDKTMSIINEICKTARLNKKEIL
jgi:hypothetical protein